MRILFNKYNIIVFFCVAILGVLVFKARFEILDFTISNTNNRSSIHQYALNYLVSLYENDRDLYKEKIIERAKLVDADHYSVMLLGIIGDKECFSVLLQKVEAYADFKDGMFENYRVKRLLDSISLIKNDITIDLFKDLKKHIEVNKEKYKDTRLYIPLNYSIARAIYILTGERYIIESLRGIEGKIPITVELAETKAIVEQSQGRQRSKAELEALLKFQLPIGKSEMNERLKVIER